MKKICLYIILLTAGHLFAQNQNRVGINIETPQSTLDVNGDMNIRQLDAPERKSVALTADDGGVLALGADKVNQYSPFYVAEYKLAPTEETKAYVNTNVPIKDFNMVLAYGFVAPLATYAGTGSVDKYWGIQRVKYGESKENDEDDLNAFKDIELLPNQETGTWFLKAQYSFAPSASGQWTNKGFYWYIRVFIVPKHVMDALSTECYKTPSDYLIKSTVNNPLSKEPNDTCN